MDQLLRSLRALGVARLVVLAGTAAATLAFIAFLVARVNAPGMALLYSDLEMEDSGRIVSKLESMAVPYQMRAEGSQIFVPADRALQLRMALAQEGLPNTGSVGYEVFDKSGSLGASSFVNDINRVRALEGELARTIKTIASIRAARVHLVLPRRELFSREKQEPSASIALRMRGGDQLTPSQVRAIQSLVAAAVPGLAPTRVSVVDQSGTLLARGGVDARQSESMAGQSDEMRRGYEQRLAKSIEDIVGRTIGHGKVRAEVTAEMDFDRVSTTSETFDPDGQVIRSTQNSQEQNDTQDGSGQGGTVSVAENLPGQETQAQKTAETAKNSNTSLRSEEIVNYEISKTVKNHVREAGIVRRLSVAVLVDGKYAAGADGAKAYAPQDAATIEQVGALVRSTIGFDANRGDVVEVVNMRFAEPDLPAEGDDSLLSKFDMWSYVRLAETFAMLAMGLVVLLLVVRPMLRRVFSGLLPAGEAARLTDQSGGGVFGQLAAPAASGQGQFQALQGATTLTGTALASPGQPNVAGALAAPNLAAAGTEMIVTEGEDLVDIQSIEGRVKASAVKKIGEIVDLHPSETAAILRNWLVEQN